MTLKYESDILFDLMKRDGDDTPSDVLPYESELKEKYLKQVEGAYPKLQDYRSEWLNYNLMAEIPADFPHETLSNVTEATVDNVVPYAYKSAALKGSTKYRDIDTGDILDTFDETKNLELVSVKMPRLTTSNEDNTKTIILTTSEEVELRGIGEVKDELDLLTGKLIKRIGTFTLNGSESFTWHGIREVTAYGFNISKDEVMKKLGESSIRETYAICNKLPSLGHTCSGTGKEGFAVNAVSYAHLQINISLNKLTESSEDGLRQYLQANPLSFAVVLEQEVDKTVELTVTDQDGKTQSMIKPIEGTMHLMTNGTPIKPTVTIEVPVEAITQNLMSFANIVEEEK